MARLPALAEELFLGGTVLIAGPEPAALAAKSATSTIRLTRQEGRLAIVAKRAVGCGGRGGAFDERR
jgi:hypothetical protein